MFLLVFIVFSLVFTMFLGISRTRTTTQDFLLAALAMGSVVVAALASAIAAGPVPSCNWIHLDGNPGSAAAVKEAFARREGLQIAS